MGLPTLFAFRAFHEVTTKRNSSRPLYLTSQLVSITRARKQQKRERKTTPHCEKQTNMRTTSQVSYFHYGLLTMNDLHRSQGIGQLTSHDRLEKLGSQQFASSCETTEKSSSSCNNNSTRAQQHVPFMMNEECVLRKQVVESL